MTAIELDGVLGGFVSYHRAPTRQEVDVFNECLSHQSLWKPSTWKIRKKCIDDFRAVTDR